MDAVRQLLAENPEWQTLERAPQVPQIKDVLLRKGFYFEKGKPSLSVNLAPTHIAETEERRRRERKLND